jgi:hypothetical protein
MTTFIPYYDFRKSIKALNIFDLYAKILAPKGIQQFYFITISKSGASSDGKSSFETGITWMVVFYSDTPYYLNTA